MPTYEYVCEKCGHEFELFQSMAAEPLRACTKEKCAQKRWGKGKVTRKIGVGAGLIFKGSGFYITDNRSDSYKAAAKKESTPAAATPAAAPAKTETKAPAAAPAKKKE